MKDHLYGIPVYSSPFLDPGTIIFANQPMSWLPEILRFSIKRPLWPWERKARARALANMGKINLTSWWV